MHAQCTLQPLNVATLGSKFPTHEPSGFTLKTMSKPQHWGAMAGLSSPGHMGCTAGAGQPCQGGAPVTRAHSLLGNTRTDSFAPFILVRTQKTEAEKYDFFLVELGFEFRASRLLGGCSTA
jgi:hypothetical protein